MGVKAESARVRRVLGAGHTFLAKADGNIVGFASSFVTPDEHGNARFELDLLGVAPSWQGRGIGARLGERSLHEADETGAATIRALVRRDNMSMRRLCIRLGFRRSEAVHQLWASKTGRPANNCERYSGARIIPVDTLTYGGYWLEGALSQGAIDEARTMLWHQPDRRVAGAVVPEYDRRAIDLLRANSFDRMGEFLWWTLSL